MNRPTVEVMIERTSCKYPSHNKNVFGGGEEAHGQTRETKNTQLLAVRFYARTDCDGTMMRLLMG